MLPFQISNYISGLNYNYNFIYIEHYIEYIYIQKLIFYQHTLIITPKDMTFHQFLNENLYNVIIRICEMSYL